ncbi:MAG: hypothetical protein QOF78_1298 [Phycisphaerales bacterium]|nr:hypothetical protein [Phycisphaerales bacterium]
MTVIIVAAPARGQAELERFSRQLEQIQRETLLQANQDLSLDQRVFFDYGGYATFGYLSVDDNVNQNHVLRQYELIGYARMNIDGAHEFFLRGAGGWRDFNPGDSFDGRGDEAIDPELDRWYYRFDLQRQQAAYYGRKIDYNITVKAGRDLVIWGNGLVLSQDIQGLDASFTWGGNEVEILAGITPTRTVDFDASRPAFDYNTKRGFYGAQLSRNVGTHRPFIYGLVQRDYNDHDTLNSGPVVTEFDYNSYYLGVGSAGPIGDRILYGVEAVYEGGTNLSNSFVSGGGPFITPIPQTKDDIRAWALDARIDYLFPDERHRPRISGEVILASGDDDRGNTSNTFSGNAPNTSDRAFNAFGLLNTGLAFAPQVSNILALRVGGSAFPLPDMGPLRRMQVGADLFLYGKLDKSAPIDEPTSGSEKFIGWEPDFFLNWQATSDVTVVLRYGIFFPNEDAFAGDDTARQYIYAGLTYAF